MLKLASTINYNHNCSFIVLATVITIVIYKHKTFIVQATGLRLEVKSCTKVTTKQWIIFCRLRRDFLRLASPNPPSGMARTFQKNVSFLCVTKFWGGHLKTWQGDPNKPGPLFYFIRSSRMVLPNKL